MTLAEDASVLVIDRFDLRTDGSYRGFEDFCVLKKGSEKNAYPALTTEPVKNYYSSLRNDTLILIRGIFLPIDCLYLHKR